MHISTVLAIHRELIPSIIQIKKTLKKKIKEFKGIIKIGRTHTQDATPIRLSNEFLAYHDQIYYAETVIKKV
jgi:fumarate hydratase class II